MATTRIWKVDSHLSRVIDYAENHEKTENAQWSKTEYQTMRDVMDYAMNDAKTEKQYYVTALNCNADCARDQMKMTKQQFVKTGGILAWHGYQSFVEGEVDADTAHEIGVKLAKELWPDYQVIVATHLNTHCYHNHFVLNSVSFLTGKKFNACKESYLKMRAASDRLCKEYWLHVITEHTAYYPKHYAEWDAAKKGQPTWRSLIREDMDVAIKSSMTFGQFIRSLRDKGYEVERRGKNLRVRPPGKERFVRLSSLGPQYEEEAIVRRILRQERRSRTPTPKQPTVRKVKVYGDFHLSKVTWKGLRALYFYYLRKLRQAAMQPKSYTPMVLREDLRYMDAISEQTKFLFKYKLDTAEQIDGLKSSLLFQIQSTAAERTSLRNLSRRVGVSEEELDGYAKQIAELTRTLKGLRKEVNLCDGVIERSLIIQEKNAQLKELHQKERAQEQTKQKAYKVRQY